MAFWKKKKKENSKDIQLKMYEEQVEKYENLDFIIATKKDKKATIKYFIESEENAMQYKIQGLIYPEFHYEIAKIIDSKMSDFTDNEILNTYYHMLRLGNWFTPHKANFPLYKKALEKILPDLEDNTYHICHLNKYDAYLMFGIINNNDKHRIASLNYDNFIEQKKFILKTAQYTNYPGMRKKRDKFIPFLSNELLMERVRKGVLLFYSYEFKFSIAGSLILLLLDKNKASKEVLIKLHKHNLPNHFVWILGSFYKDFQSRSLGTENKNLLSHLYANYPSDWIDEYQKQTY